MIPKMPLFPAHREWETISTWELTNALVYTYMTKGPHEAGDILRRCPDRWELIRKQAYFCYIICERQKNPKEALGYNRFLYPGWEQIMNAIKAMYQAEGDKLL